MFDCVIPTRSGRTAQAFTARGTINLKNARHAGNNEPIDGDCQCSICASYTRGYMHHLFKSREILGAMLLTEHNLSFYQSLMTRLRTAVLTGELARFSKEFLQRYVESDSAHD